MGGGGGWCQCISVSNFILKANFLVCPQKAAAEHDGSLGGAAALAGSGLPGLLWDLFSFDYGKNNPRYFCACRAFLMTEKICCQVGTRGKCHLERQHKCVWIRFKNPNKLIFSDFQKLLLQGGGGGEETVAQLNLDLLWWNLVEFTAIHSSRHERRVSSAACQGIITDLLQARNVAEALSGLLGLHNVGGLMRLCASPWLRTATLEEEERDQWCCSCLSNVCLVTGSAKHSGGALGRIDYAPQGYLF